MSARLLAALLAAAGPLGAAPLSAPPASMQGNPVADAAFIHAVDADWFPPRSAEFVAQAQRLTESIGRVCQAGPSGVPTAQAQWLQTVASWERLSAVRAGALLARRSPREIDFLPPRAEAIGRAIAAAPADAAALDRIGSPAKGLPALEWLLWSRPLGTDPAACGYARLVATGMQSEAEALQAAYQRTLAQGRDASEVEYAMYELLNLWDAGLQKLWWEEMDRPLQQARDGRAVPLDRSLSGHTVAGWRQQWQSLRTLAVGDATGGGPSLQGRIRADGHAAEADRLVARVAEVDAAMAALGADPASPLAGPAIAASIAALKDLQQYAETEMAAALNFIVSFFDEDGD